MAEKVTLLEACPGPPTLILMHLLLSTRLLFSFCVVPHVIDLSRCKPPFWETPFAHIDIIPDNIPRGYKDGVSAITGATLSSLLQVRYIPFQIGWLTRRVNELKGMAMSDTLFLSMITTPLNEPSSRTRRLVRSSFHSRDAGASDYLYAGNSPYVGGWFR